MEPDQTFRLLYQTGQLLGVWFIEDSKVTYAVISREKNNNDHQQNIVISDDSLVLTNLRPGTPTSTTYSTRGHSVLRRSRALGAESVHTTYTDEADDEFLRIAGLEMPSSRLLLALVVHLKEMLS